MNHKKLFINDSDDPTYENWLALYACIVNKNLSAGKSLQIMELMIDKKNEESDRNIFDDITGEKGCSNDC